MFSLEGTTVQEAWAQTRSSIRPSLPPSLPLDIYHEPRPNLQKTAMLRRAKVTDTRIKGSGLVNWLKGVWRKSQVAPEKNSRDAADAKIESDFILQLVLLPRTRSKWQQQVNAIQLASGKAAKTRVPK
mmetsp:Transcript_24177/g.53623  ORF Transcript_24177/g.53623 Transcript_24177/m.53623 type:complete len:128 (-) Transcript_24177:1294-1677(-)